MILYDCGLFIYEMQKPCYKQLLENCSNITEKKSIIRNVLLNSILDISKKYQKKYGKIILCMDNKKGYWRKDFFPYYKSQRKKHQEKDNFDWQEFFKCLDEVLQEFEQYLPIICLNVEKCEADDVIALMCKYFQTHDLDIIGNPNNHLIVSNDHDLSQLQFYSGVTNYSPKKNKEIVLNNNEVHQLLIEHICCGDTGDGIMNICSDDDTFINEEKKQTPFRKSRLVEFYVDGINACKNDYEKRNYQRNKKLVDLINEIPDELYQNVTSKYENYKINNQINTYMTQYRLGNFYEKLQFLL